MLKIQHLPCILLLILLVCTGCVRREGRNSDCQWPGTLNQADLSADLEFAWELAIRYMDAHFGPRDPDAASRAMNRCVGTLMAEIGKERGITAQEAFRSFGRRSAAVDLAANLPFVLLYALGADLLIRRLLRRYPPGEGWTSTIVTIILACVVFSVVGLMLGQFWSSSAESLRVGTSHLSNRTFRLPIYKHPGGAFLLGMAVFLSIASLRCWSRRNAPVP